MDLGRGIWFLARIEVGRWCGGGFMAGDAAECELTFQGGGGAALDERYQNELSSPGFDFLTSDDVFGLVVTAFDQDIGPELQDEFARGVLIEEDDGVHGFQGA